MYSSSPVGFTLGQSRPKAPVAKNKKGTPEKKTKNLRSNESFNGKKKTYPITKDRMIRNQKTELGVFLFVVFIIKRFL